MEGGFGATGRVFAAGIALLALAALVLQCGLLIETNRGSISSGMSLLRFFSYFTILSNCLVAAATAAAAIESGGSQAGVLGRPGVRAGVALYIAITGLVYVLVLRGLWQPTGAQWWADTLLHYVVPLSYLSWWALLAPHGALRWRHLPRWLLFPLAYVAWIVFRQRAIETWSPYPFLDLGIHGPQALLTNIVTMLGLFVGLGALLIGLDRLIGRRRRIN